MKLTLLPLQNDDVLRVRCEGPLALRGDSLRTDPLQMLLGPHCYGHKVMLNLERAHTIDTSGICWLVQSHNRFSEARGSLVLYAVPPTVTDLLDFLQLRPLLCITAAEGDARRLVNGNGAASHDGDPVTVPT